MRGSGTLRTSAVPGGVLTGPWVRNALWRNARAVPSLDLDFANNKSLTDRVTSQNLVSFTRASSATYVDSSGVLQRAVTNLVPGSTDFSATYTALSNVTVSADTTVAPDGSFTADTVTGTSSSLNIKYLYKNYGTNITGAYTASIYLKTSTQSIVLLRLNDNTGNNGARQLINLSTGALSGSVVTDGTATGASATINSAGNGWYRCTVTCTFNSALTGLQGPSVYHDGYTTSTSTNSYFAWGAQLEQASTVGDYVPTTSTINSAPRFTHDPTTGESLGLMGEEARTNSIRNNTMVGAVAGTPGTNPTNWFTYVSSGTGVPTSIIGTGTDNGVNYVDIRFNGTSSASAVWSVITESAGIIPAATGQVWTYSAWIKIASGSNSNVSNPVFFFDETVGSTFVTGASISTSFLTSALNRYSTTYTLTGGATVNRVNAGIRFSVTSGQAIDITLRIGLPQLEQGAFATSVIPTTSATVTRAADVASITGSNFGTTRTNLLLRSEEFGASWTSGNITVSPDVIVAPNGTLTADKTIATTTNTAHQLYQVTSGTSGVTYTISFYVKAGEYNRFNFGPGNAAVGGDKVVTINLGLSNPIVSQDAIFNSSAFAAPVGDGWYRVGATFTATATGTMTVAVLQTIINNAGSASFAGDGTSGLFLWGAQLETGSAATPYIPSTTTFTSRASGASYFDAAGVLQWKPQNLLVRSEEFDNASWGKTGLLAFGSGSTANAIAAPNGSITADLLTEDTSTGQHRVTQTVSGTVNTNTYTLSVYVKAKERTRFYVGIVDSPGFSRQGNAIFNLSNGTVVSASTGLNGATGGVASIQDVGNGWYRCSYALVLGGTNTAVFCDLNIVSTGSTISYTGDGTSGIYLWGAQLEQNAGSFTVPGEYTPTVATATGGARNSAFLPDSSGVFRSAGPLLLEEARTNVIQQSEAFSTGWVGSGYTTSTPAITSPSGQSGVYSVNEVSTAASQHYLAYLYSIPGSTPYTFSFFVKANQRNNISLRYYFADTNWVARVFDLSGSGALTQSSTGSAADVTSISQSIVSCPNGWYRISLTLTQPTTRSAYFSIDGCTTSTPTLDAGPGIQLYTGDVNKGYYLWGAQEEAGAYPSSYIPTTTSAVTRAADVSTSTATSVFESSWYNQTEGTVFAEFGPYGNGGATKNPGIVQIDSGSGVNTIRMFCGGSTSPVLGVDTSSVNQAYISSGTLTPSLTSKITGAYRVNDFARAVNGANLGTDSSGTVPTVSQMLIGTGSAGVTELNGTIKRLVYWGQRLPNTTLQSITL